MEDKLTYKSFTKDDIDLFFRWANDEESRKNSFNSSPISYETHVKWCYDKLESSYVDIFVIYLNNVPVAQLRLVYEGNEAYISYSIDIDYRRLGLGYRVIKLIEDEKLVRANCKKLIGMVKEDNIASQKVFEYCKYDKTVNDKHLIYSKNIC